MDTNLVNTLANLGIMVATVAGVWLVLRSNKKQSVKDQEARHKEILSAVTAKIEKEYEEKKLNEKRLRGIEEAHTQCRTERTEETNERFNNIENGQKMAQQSAENMEKTFKAQINALSKEWDLKFNSLNKEWNLKIAALSDKVDNLQEALSDIIKILNSTKTAEKPVSKTKRVSKNDAAG